MSCNMESEDLCGWIQDSSDDFDWTLNNYGTPSSHLGTGPSFDHTLGAGKGGKLKYSIPLISRADVFCYGSFPSLSFFLSLLLLLVLLSLDEPVLHQGNEVASVWGSLSRSFSLFYHMVMKSASQAVHSLHKVEESKICMDIESSCICSSSGQILFLFTLSLLVLK